MWRHLWTIFSSKDVIRPWPIEFWALDTKKLRLSNEIFHTNICQGNYSKTRLYNEHAVIKNKFLGKIGHFSSQMNPVITKIGNNEQKLTVPSTARFH